VTSAGDAEALEVPVTNMGRRTGREIVQAYLQPPDEPIRLVGWAVVDDVAPGERRVARVSLDHRAMRVWDVAADSWRGIEGGRLLVARGLGDVRGSVDRPRPQ
jgi:beta-glucosidase